MSRRLLWTVVGAVLLVIGYLLITTTFMFYDDEGFVLQSLRAYLGGQRLYDDVFTQYGPWPYLYHQVITAVLQTPMTHMLGREITLFHWVATALLCGAVTHHLTRRTAPAVATALIVFAMLQLSVAEPTHPGSLIALLVALALLGAVRLPERPHPTAEAFGLGIIAAALLLTKINVGIFLLAGAGGGLLWFTRWPGAWGRAVRVAIGAGLILLPWALIGSRFRDPFPLGLALFFSVAAAALLWTLAGEGTEVALPARTWKWAVPGLLGGLALICSVILARGTSLSALIFGVLIQPLQHPAHFIVSFTWPLGAWVALGVATLLAVLARCCPGPVTDRMVAAARALVAILYLAGTSVWVTYFGDTYFLAYGLALFPLFFFPLRPARTEPSLTLARYLLAWIALLQVLHVFPIAGSQRAWAGFALVPLFVTGCDEAWETLRPLWPKSGSWLPRLGWALLLFSGVGQIGSWAHTGWLYYSNSHRIDLPGTGDMRLDGRNRMTLRLLTLNASIHADLLYSRPGMFSYNLWSGVPTPTGQNATHWFWLLDPPSQESIVRHLAATPKSAIITSRYLDRFAADNNIPVQGPLQDYILHHYRPLFEHREMVFLVPGGSRAVPFGLITWYRSASVSPAHQPAYLMQANLTVNGRPIRVSLDELDPPWRREHAYTPADAQISLEPITREGQPCGPAVRLPCARPLHGLYRLSVASDFNPALGSVILTLQDNDGPVSCEAVYNEAAN